jgi:hypothetical protein
VPQGNGIRRSKDLRARFRKFLILTNERKQMSKTTLRKRISLVAVTALTAGVLSVVATPAANAGFGSNVEAGNATNPALAVADTLYIAAVSTTSGSATALATSGTAISATPDVTSANSLGLVDIGDLAATTGLTAGTTTTAVLLGTGAISVYVGQTTDTGGTIVVTGGTITSSTGIALNSTATAAAGGTNTDERNWGVVAKPNTGVTSMTIQYYSGYTMTGTAATDAGIVANPTGATGLSLQGQITVTVTTSSVAGVSSCLDFSCLWSRSMEHPRAQLH